MNVAMLLEMAVDALDDRVAIGRSGVGIPAAELLSRARRAAHLIEQRDIEHFGLIDVNSLAVPIGLFGSAIAGVPFVPMNYRLSDEQLRGLVTRIAPAMIVVDAPIIERLGDIDGIELVPRDSFLADVASRGPTVEAWGGTGDETAVLLFTSGTTGEPKAAVLRHRQLVSYVISTVDFAGAGADEATLVSVPPYHIAGISVLLTSVYAGRRVVALPSFDAHEWVEVARDEGVTQAMVVPTMLARILDELERLGSSLPTLRHLSYGGGPMPLPVIERAMHALPDVDFVNAYGLTETSSTVALLGPDDHREAAASNEEHVRRRLGSVGRPLPTLECSIRDDDGSPLATGEIGEIWVRGEQVSGEYLGGTAVRDDGWFPTKDAGYLDDEGYLFVEGRLDDVIVRGGENMSPGEIEAVLVRFPGVADAAVVGLPDDEWGEQVVAAIVLREGASVDEDELRDYVRRRLRSSRTPERIAFVLELPYNETGKLLRRVLRAELLESRDVTAT